ncbi:hypothetical protein [Enterobacter hormaechei]|nr:hypothetical protein [Enterobacter hormaechei]MDK2357425.1 hypothetical protein [Enterobacter hormaechei]
MTEQTNDKRLHLTLPKTSSTQLYTAHSLGGGGATTLPQRDRQTHGQTLKTQLQLVKTMSSLARSRQEGLQLISGFGVQVEFVGQPDVALAFESLGSEVGKNKARHIEVLSIHK